MFKKKVEWVPPNMTPDEARRARKQQLRRNKPGLAQGVGMVLLLVLFIGFSGWWFFGRGSGEAQADQRPTAQVSRIEPIQLTATAQANEPTAAATPTAEITPTITPGLMAVLTSTVTVTPTGITLLAFNSPVGTPMPTTTPTATATPTPNPFDYSVLGHDVTAEGLYSYISGWVVEKDGSTPRPVAVRVVMSDGNTMRFPRPNNSDVATGHYEFLVSPGVYRLEIPDGKTEPVTIVVSDNPERHEVSFRYSGTRRATVAYSNPWSKNVAKPASLAAIEATPTATAAPTYTHRIYLPLINKETRNYERQIFLPVIQNGND